jgi:hypothetical protein
MSKDESQFLLEQIETTKKALAEINPIFEAYRKQINTELNDLLRKAGIFDEYAKLTHSVEEARKQLQSRADQLTAALSSYEQIYAKFHSKDAIADDDELDDDSDEWPIDDSDEIEE